MKYTGVAWKHHISSDFIKNPSLYNNNGVKSGGTIFLDFDEMVKYLKNQSDRQWCVCKLFLNNVECSEDFENLDMVTCMQNVHSISDFIPLNDLIVLKNASEHIDQIFQNKYLDLKLYFKDIITVSKKIIISYVSHYLIRQSPYAIPNNLETILIKLNYNLNKTFDKEQYIFFNYLTLYKLVQNSLNTIPQFMQLNKSKNDPNNDKLLFVSMYDNINPDDDFIDVQALFRNVTDSIFKQE